jgi:hypothetical protein
MKSQCFSLFSYFSNLGISDIIELDKLEGWDDYMKYFETNDYSFFLGKNHFIYDVEENEDTLHIYLKSKPHGCKCPVCGMESNELHATYKRVIQDTPIRCKQTFLHANVYKYDCENPECERKVFMENLPFAKSSQVRTYALNTLILGVAMFLSNEGASKVLAHLSVTISNDSIQRLYDRIEFVDNPNVEEVGIDDVAIRKGQTYATAIYDIKDHRLLALLDGRDAETLKIWLKKHKKIRLVARDRASAYASAINEILPECTQVADRFHLLQNLLGYLKDIFKDKLPSSIYVKDGEVLDYVPEKILKEKKFDKEFIDSLHYDNSPPKNPDGTTRIYDNKKHKLTSKRYIKHAESRKKTTIDLGNTKFLE